MKKGVSNALIGGLGLVAGSIGGVISGALITDYLAENKNQVTGEERYKEYYSILNQWLIIKQDGINLSSYFHEHNMKKIAIYGMGELGARLYDELKDTDIEVPIALDQGAFKSVYPDLKLIRMNELEKRKEELADIDAIIVTVTLVFDNVSDNLKPFVQCPIISLRDVLVEL